MASLKKRLPTNTPGEFFVDSTCINCDTCRQLAPATPPGVSSLNPKSTNGTPPPPPPPPPSPDTGNFPSLSAHPADDTQRREATRALLACPTGSIGTTGHNIAKDVIADFPLQLEPGVYYCGFNSEKSFGGNSYFVQHPGGNWLIDSPRFMSHLVRRFEELGGIQNIFLTHRDDVADAADYAKKLNARRIIHRQELASQPGAECVLDGEVPVPFGNDFL